MNLFFLTVSSMHTPPLTRILAFSQKCGMLNYSRLTHAVSTKCRAVRLINLWRLATTPTWLSAGRLFLANKAGFVIIAANNSSVPTIEQSPQIRAGRFLLRIMQLAIS